LLGGLAMLSLGTGGCEFERPEPSAAPTSGAPTTTSEDADLEVLDQTRADLLALVALLQDVRTRHPGLRRVVAPLLRAHRQHLDVLDGAGRPSETDPTPVTAAGRPRRAYAAALQAEQDLIEATALRLVAVRSGEFARLLAGIRAGTAQAITALREGP
jgi:hypothetical protein